MTTSETPSEATVMANVRSGARQGVALILVGAALFFAALAGLSGFREFLAGSEDSQLSSGSIVAGRLDVLAEQRGQVLVGFVLVGIGELLLGVGMWVLVAAIARAEVGWRRALAWVSAWACCAGGVLSIVVQLWPPVWVGSDDAVAAIGESSPSAPLLVLAWILLAAGFLGTAVVVVTGACWPTWAGAVLALFGILPLVTNLPLFFQVGGVVAGVGVAVSAGRTARAVTGIAETG